MYIFISVFNRFCDGNIVVKGCAIPDPSLEVDDTGSGGAVLLLTSHRFPKLKRLVSGFLAVGV